MVAVKASSLCCSYQTQKGTGETFLVGTFRKPWVSFCTVAKSWGVATHLEQIAWNATVRPWSKSTTLSDFYVPTCTPALIQHAHY